MTSKTEEIAEKIEELPDTEKAMLVDVILAKLDQPDAGLDKIWAEEATKRWAAHKEGRLKSLPYDEVIKRSPQPQPTNSANSSPKCVHSSSPPVTPPLPQSILYRY